MSPLREIPDLTDCPKLTKLTLNGNQLTRLPVESAALPALELLHISSNEIVDWPKRLSSSLKSLFVDRNKLEELPDVVLTAKSLEVLRLSGNPIRELPSALSLLPLRFLDVSGTQLTAFPPILATLPKLEHLLLNNTKIEQWPAFPPPPKLKRFSAHGAPFMKVEPPPAWRRFVA